MAYFGWSAAYDDGSVLWDTPADVPEEAASDPVVIARANPALGIRIELEHVLETELPAMDHVTFCVERLGIGNWPALTGPEQRYPHRGLAGADGPGVDGARSGVLRVRRQAGSFGRGDRCRRRPV
jgi:hypothetical protein